MASFAGVVKKVSEYAKGAVAGSGALFVVVDSAVDDGSITQGEWFAIAVAVATFIGVVAVPNKPKA